jgi:hypothetical protein
LRLPPLAAVILKPFPTEPSEIEAEAVEETVITSAIGSAAAAPTVEVGATDDERAEPVTVG